MPTPKRPMIKPMRIRTNVFRLSKTPAIRCVSRVSEQTNSIGEVRGRPQMESFADVAARRGTGLFELAALVAAEQTHRVRSTELSQLAKRTGRVGTRPDREERFGSKAMGRLAFSLWKLEFAPSEGIEHPVADRDGVIQQSAIVVDGHGVSVVGHLACDNGSVDRAVAAENGRRIRCIDDSGCLTVAMDIDCPRAGIFDLNQGRI